MKHPEETLNFQVGSAFYRPQMRYVRDLGVLAAIVYRQEKGHLRVLEPMSGCGIRSLRYGLEAGADWIWANDGNPEIQEVLRSNLEQHLELEKKAFHRNRKNLTVDGGLQTHPSRLKLIAEKNLEQNLAQDLAQDYDRFHPDPDQRIQVTAWDAHKIFAHCILHQDEYDFVDMDGFGNLSAYLHLVWSAIKPGGFLYWTATDGQILGGHDPDRCLQRYGTYGRSFPCAQEQGLRIVLGSLAAAAQQLGIDIEPIFSTFTGQTFRTLIRRLPVGQNLGSFTDRYGFLGYCHHCGEYQPVGWRTLGQVLCPWHNEPASLTLSGPLWLGSLHHSPTLQAMKTIAQTWNYDQNDRLLKRLDLMIAETPFPPYHFSLGQLGKWAKSDPPNRDRFFESLRQQGFEATLLHWNPECFKTTAPWKTCLQTCIQTN